MKTITATPASSIKKSQSFTPHEKNLILVYSIFICKQITRATYLIFAP
ncbi:MULTISPECIES: hypothetical protein [Nitrosomonas]|nr:MULTISPECIES: hypothetical protein [Nitrosomonas]UVS62539.1 hypothetical protein NX761_05300 [Nitrosomonas sp. PLL12]